MTKTRCPFCGKNGARLDPEVLKFTKISCEAVTCKNPSCKCYDPLTYGYHQNMRIDVKKFYLMYMKARAENSDI